jgi:hypothetical protein
MLRAAVVLTLLLSGCSHTKGGEDETPPDAAVPAPTASGTPKASAEPSTTAEAPRADSPLPTATPAPPMGAPPAPREAQRITIAKLADDKLLAPHQAVLQKHFGDALPSPLEAQIALLDGDRRAVLVSGPARDRRPILLVLDAQGALLWTKERPLAGTRQVVTEMVPAAGPKGEVALLWYDIPTQVVALRKWAWDGIVLADFEVVEVDLVESLSALYWPGHGWLAVASKHGAARAQLLDERGKRAFGPRGVELPWRARPSAPAAIVVDSDTSAMIFQVGDLPREGGAFSPDRLLGTRLDTLGARLWERPLDLGPGRAERPIAVVQSPDRVRVTLGKGLSTNVTSRGSILAR